MADGWDDVDFSGWQLSHFLSWMPFIDSSGLPLVLGEPHTTVHRTLVDRPADGIDFRREREQGTRTAPSQGARFEGAAAASYPCTGGPTERQVAGWSIP